MTNSLYEQLGGAEAMQAAVDLFYERVLADPKINHFFEGRDMGKQRAMQTAFLSMVFGGPATYSGRTLRQAHAGLPLDDSHFDAVARHLQATLDDLGVPAELADQVMGIAASTRDDVLNR